MPSSRRRSRTQARNGGRSPVAPSIARRTPRRTTPGNARRYGRGAVRNGGRGKPLPYGKDGMLARYTSPVQGEVSRRVSRKRRDGGVVPYPRVTARAERGGVEGSFPRSAEHCSAKSTQNNAGQCPALRGISERRATKGRPYGADGAAGRVGSDPSPLIAPQTGCRGRQPLQRRTERWRGTAGDQRSPLRRGRDVGAGRRATKGRPYGADGASARNGGRFVNRPYGADSR